MSKFIGVINNIKNQSVADVAKENLNSLCLHIHMATKAQTNTEKDIQTQRASISNLSEQLATHVAALPDKRNDILLLADFGKSMLLTG